MLSFYEWLWPELARLLSRAERKAMVRRVNKEVARGRRVTIDPPSGPAYVTVSGYTF